MLKIYFLFNFYSNRFSHLFLLICDYVFSYTIRVFECWWCLVWILVFNFVPKSGPTRNLKLLTSLLSDHENLSTMTRSNHYEIRMLLPAKALNIKWEYYVTNTKVLKRVNSQSIQELFIKYSL